MWSLKKIELFVFSLFLVGIAPQICLAATDIGKTLRFLSSKEVPAKNRLSPKQFEFAEKNIIRGIVVLNSILTDTYSFPNISVNAKINQREFQKDIAAVNWALFHFAVNRGEPFISGSYSIVEDRNQSTNTLAELHLNHPKAYERKSSHNTELKRVLKVQDYGIDHLGSFNSDQTDWNPRGTDDELPILPGNKSHLLFQHLPADFEKSCLKKNVLFIKPETHGTRKGFFQHSKSYLLKKGLGQVSTSFSRTEDVPESIQKDFQDYLEEIQNHPGITSGELQNYYAQATLAGVRAIHQAIQDLQKKRDTCSDQFSKTAVIKEKSLLEKIEKIGHPKHLEYRTGNEVIFLESELLALTQEPVFESCI